MRKCKAVMGNIVKMNETDITRFKTLIHKSLAQLDDTLAQGAEGTQTVELDQQAIGRLSRQDALLNQAMAKAGQTRRAQEQTRLRAALARMEDGEYGYCTDCGEDIPPKRLELDLAATLCVSCASG